MKTLSKLLVAAMLICSLAALSASAQTFAPRFGTQLQLGGNAGGITPITLTAPGSGITSYTLTLPPTIGAMNQVLITTDGAGTLGWATVATGSGTATGTNTGDVTIAGGSENYVTLGAGTQVLTIHPVNLNSTNVTSTLQVGNGGTGLSTLTAAGSMLYSTSASALTTLAPTATNGSVLTYNTGTTAPQWTAVLPPANGGTGVSNTNTITITGGNVTINGPSSGGGLLSGGTANTIPIWTSGTVLGNSTITDAAGTLSTTENLSLTGANKTLTFTGNGAGVTTFTAGAQGGTNINYTLPIAAPLTNTGYALTSTTGGVMSWAQFATGTGTVTGTNTGDQTITLTTDVTGSGTGTFAATIAGHAVTNAKFRQSAGLSVVGTSGNATADVADITSGGANRFLVTNNTPALAFAALNTGASLTGDGITNALGVVANTTNQKVEVMNNGTSVGTRKTVNFIPGTNVTYTIADNSGSDRVDVTINSSGGGGSAELFARKSTDVTLTASNINLQADPDLQLTLAANSTYEFSGVIAYNGSTSASNLKLALAFSGTTTSIRWSTDQGGTANTPSSVTAVATAGTTGTAGTNIIGNFVADNTPANNLSVFVSGVIVVGASGGTLQMLESQATSQAATTTILTNSFLRAVKVQ
ncbi:MAG TPA: hypothetical protein VEW28_07460 [Candidatus Kapabacteria bacterium]|nr:hypothetical protein [Candidatus Kapabacteria bacterium]